MFISEEECVIAKFRSAFSERLGLWITVAGIIALGIVSFFYSTLLELTATSSLNMYFIG